MRERRSPLPDTHVQAPPAATVGIPDRRGARVCRPRPQGPGGGGLSSLTSREGSQDANGGGMPELRRVRSAPAALITRQASMQSYLTIRGLADRAYRSDAFALYAYFRWLDDMVDERLAGEEERRLFVSRQRGLLAEAAITGQCVDVSPEEALLVDLVDPARPGVGGRSRGVDAREGLLRGVTSRWPRRGGRRPVPVRPARPTHRGRRTSGERCGPRERWNVVG